MHRMPWITLILTSLLLTVYAAAGPAPGTLVYDRAAILGGDIWRFATGHLVHLDQQHFLVNTAACALLGVTYETATARLRTILLIAGSAIAISVALLFLSPGTAFYCGISAVLNALFAATVIKLWRETDQKFWLLLLAGDFLKILCEWQFGSIFSSGLAWPPHYGAHLTGFLFGLIFELSGPASRGTR